MKTRKGMTLIEVLLALMLLGLIAVSFLPASVNSFRLMSKSKSITTEAFAAQQEIEINIDKLRKDIQKGAIIGDKLELSVTFTNSLTPMVIDGKVINGINNNTDLIAFIPIVTKPIDPKFPNVSVKIKPENIWSHKIDNTDIESVNVFTKTNSKLVGEIVGKEMDYETMVYRLVHNWYLSNEDYNQVKLPSFPEEYTKISTLQKDIPNLSYVDELPILDSYTNKILVYTITQVSKAGRYGEIISKPMLVLDEVPNLELGINHKNSGNVDYPIQTSPLKVINSDKLLGYVSNYPDSFAGTHAWYVSNASFVGNAATVITSDNIGDFDLIPSSDTNTLVNLSTYKDKWIVYRFNSVYKTNTKPFFSKPVKIDVQTVFPVLVRERGGNLLPAHALANYEDKLAAKLIDESGNITKIDSGTINWYRSKNKFTGDLNIVLESTSKFNNDNIAILNKYTNSNNIKGYLVRFGLTVNGVETLSNPIYVIDDRQFNIVPYGASGDAADIRGGNSTEGQDLIIWTIHSNANQRYRFIPSIEFYKLQLDYGAGDDNKRFLQAQNNKEITQQKSGSNQNWVIETINYNGSYYFRFRNLLWGKNYMYVNGTRENNLYTNLTSIILSENNTDKTFWDIKY